MKAQGNQLTKLKVKEIVLNHAIEGDEPWPELENKAVEKSTEDETYEDDQSITEELDSDGDSNTVEWDIKKKEDDEDNDQTKLF
jgi:topoisomerase IV subunit A